MYDFIIVGAGIFGSTFAYEARRKGKKVLDGQAFNDILKLAKEMNSLEDKEEQMERRPIGFNAIAKSEKSSSETAKEKGKEKAEEVKKQEAPAPTSKKVNASVKNKK